MDQPPPLDPVVKAVAQQRGTTHRGARPYAQRGTGPAQVQSVARTTHVRAAIGQPSAGDTHLAQTARTQARVAQAQWWAGQPTRPGPDSGGILAIRPLSFLKIN